MVMVRMVRGENGRSPRRERWRVSPEGVPGLEGSYTLTAEGVEVSAPDARLLCDTRSAGVLGGRAFVLDQELVPAPIEVAMDVQAPEPAESPAEDAATPDDVQSGEVRRPSRRRGGFRNGDDAEDKELTDDR